MRRNIRNEIWTAVTLVLLLLAVALSAMLLTTVNQEPDPTGTAVDIISNVEEATATPSHTPTLSSTPTASPATSDTPVATTTPSPTATLSATPTYTATATASATRTPTFTNTPSQQPSATRRRNAATETTASATMTATSTTTPRPTTTATPTSTPIPLAEATTPPCTPPADWTTYSVQYGNTLFSIARAVGSTVGELRTINCIPDADNIGVGDELFVPRPPSGPVRTGVPQIPEDPTAVIANVEGCTIAASSISSPAPGTRLRGLFTVSGTAALENFQYYRLEVRPDFTNIYNFYARSEQQVVNGPLGQINAELFDDGLYWVRLTVVDNTGNFIQPCAIPVIFE